MSSLMEKLEQKYDTWAISTYQDLLAEAIGFIEELEVLVGE